MARISVRLRRDQVLKDGSMAIYFNLYDGSDYPISSGKSVHEKYWDDKKKLVKASHPLSIPINRLIESRLREVNTYIINQESKGASISRIIVKDIISGRPPLSLSGYVSRWLESKRNICVTETFRRREAMAKQILEYWGDTPVSDITEQSIKDWISHLKRSGNVPPTINKKVSEMRSIFEIAVASGDVVGNPFHKIRVGKKTTNVKPRLTPEEIVKLSECIYPDNIQLSVDAFLFSYYSYGMRFMDVCLVSRGNITGNRLRYRMHKTGHEMNVLITSPLLRIIDRYASRGSRYLLPLLKGSYDMNEISRLYDGSKLTPAERKRALRSEEKLISEKQTQNAIANRNLKMACAMAGIPKWITFHTARHSVAEGVRRLTRDTKAVQNLLGHGSLSTTENYIDPVDQDAMDRAAESLFTGIQ